MGDRAIVVLTDGTDYSPAIYLHWNGTEVPVWLEEHKTLMEGRTGDLPYAAARFLGIAHSHISGNLSLGMWNLNDDDRRGLASAEHREATLRGMSHGDAGTILVNVDDFSWSAYGGYLEDYDHENKRMNVRSE